ncbi:LacI family DNA-binding transcriptional regulator [Gellertiella hungarica]|uniref:LacI family transcriptional regulator n=1 Tax=Gellertiella hungarica TaxID=1572859 RepID=A0A7W6J2P8_9HYPH|nr:LacI family DNA-binding transcriptional regulator [Gellertiella hungarica]MBB4063002.1 LacI family transcriptional regulator [Gellertiella hungarica]
MKPTVHDIASEAGVSLATVDRVLNGRPGVRAPTRERVLAAIQKLGFVRDVAAANLAKGRVYPLVFIVPANDNSFMAALRGEIAAAGMRGAQERTAISILTVPAFDIPALVRALDAARAEKPAGVAVVAIDAEPVREAVARLAADGIPVVTLVSDLPDSARSHFAGIDNEAAGRTAGSLMGRFLDGRRGAIGIIVGSLDVRDHRERLDGFRAAISAPYPDLSLLSPLEGRDEPERVHQMVSRLLAEEPELLGLYSLGAGNRGLIRALEERRPARPIRVIAHELTPHTRGALETGLIDTVLNQDAGHEVRSAIRVLKARADGQPVIAAQERIRIDIFLKDNLP